MTTLNLQVGASEDDARQNATTTSITSLSGTSDATNEYHGFRWRNVTIAPGSTINSAVLSVCIESSSLDQPIHRFWGEDHDNAPVFSATPATNISDRTKTTASVDWDSANLGSADEEFHSPPDVSAIIQEIADRAGWASGNAIVIFDTQHTSDGTRDLGILFWDTDPLDGATLDITYTAGGGADPATHLLAQAANQRRASRSIRGVRKVSR